MNGLFDEPFSRWCLNNVYKLRYSDYLEGEAGQVRATDDESSPLPCVCLSEVECDGSGEKQAESFRDEEQDDGESSVD